MRKVRLTEKELVFVIESEVQAYLKRFAEAAYRGRLSTSEVQRAVSGILIERGIVPNKETEGEILDAVRHFGPVGEDDRAWLQKNR